MKIILYLNSERMGEISPKLGIILLKEIRNNECYHKDYSILKELNIRGYHGMTAEGYISIFIKA